jgi:hypothetical protein
MPVVYRHSRISGPHSRPSRGTLNLRSAMELRQLSPTGVEPVTFGSGGNQRPHLSDTETLEPLAFYVNPSEVASTVVRLRKIAKNRGFSALLRKFCGRTASWTSGRLVCCDRSSTEGRLHPRRESAGRSGWVAQSSSGSKTVMHGEPSSFGPQRALSRTRGGVRSRLSLRTWTPKRTSGPWLFRPMTRRRRYTTSQRRPACPAPSRMASATSAGV